MKNMDIVFINDATFGELLKLPGVGPKSARSILRKRAGLGTLYEDDFWDISYLNVTRQLLEMVSFGPARVQREGEGATSSNPGGVPYSRQGHGGGGSPESKGG
jgi:hypothetical protein